MGGALCGTFGAVVSGPLLAATGLLGGAGVALLSQEMSGPWLNFVAVFEGALFGLVSSLKGTRGTRPFLGVPPILIANPFGRVLKNPFWATRHQLICSLDVTSSVGLGS